MIVNTQLRFKRRNDPFPWEMEGREGISYSFMALDEDDEKVKVKCSRELFEALGAVEEGAVLVARLQVRDPRVDGADGVAVVVGETGEVSELVER